MENKLKSIVFATDCADIHTITRVEKAFADLAISNHIIPIPIHGQLGSHGVEHMASLHAIDQLACSNYLYIDKENSGIEHVLVLNAAPRSKKVQGKNGSPFCLFFIGNTCVLSTFNESLLGLIADAGFESDVHVFDRIKTPEALVKEFNYSESILEYLIHTQFRSLEWLPRLVYVLRKYGFDTSHPSIAKMYDRNVAIKKLSEYKNHLELSRVLLIDCFGNIKTSISEKIIPKNQKEVVIDFIKDASFSDTKTLTLTVFDSLDEVPEGKLGLVKGSSGMYGNRFYELMVGKQNALSYLEKESIVVTTEMFLKIANI